MYILLLYKIKHSKIKGAQFYDQHFLNFYAMRRKIFSQDFYKLSSLHKSFL